MNRLFKNSFLVVTVLLTMGAVALPAAAFRSVGALAGRARYVADAACFDEYGGGVANTCASTKEYRMPMVIDSNGANKSVSVSVTAVSGAPICCYSFGTNDQNTSWWTSPNTCIYLGQGWITSSVYVPTNGELAVDCTVGSGGHLNNVWFTPE